MMFLRLMQLLQDHGVPVAHMHPLLNRFDEAGALEAAAIDKALPAPIAHRVANDATAMQACVHLGLPLHEHAPGSPVLRDLRQLGSQCLGLPLPHRRGWRAAGATGSPDHAGARDRRIPPAGRGSGPARRRHRTRRSNPAGAAGPKSSAS